VSSLPILKPAKYIGEKPAAQRPPLLKPARFASFEKLSVNSKAFGLNG
jgi:hypothetical protein